jgi:glycosyltransferase involved in cell wall biosynthesis
MSSSKRLPDKAVFMMFIHKFKNKFFTKYYQPKLNDLAIKHRTDKFHHGYMPYYERYFAPIRHKKLNILEIGIGEYTDTKAGGASLKLWHEYFPNSMIYGIDVYDKSHLDSHRIKTFIANQNDPTRLEQIGLEIGWIDIIIDDGSHRSEHIVTSFQTLFPYLSDTGIYVIEDLHASYWTTFKGDDENLNEPEVSRAMLKGLTEGLNHGAILNKIPNYFDNNIESVHFYPSLAFIFKGENKHGFSQDLLTEHGLRRGGIPTIIDSQPLVSVIITANPQSELRVAVESVLMQTYQNIEIIIIDTGSHDTPRVDLAPYLSQVTYLQQDSQEISSIYNHGIDIAQGEYVCFLEADDCWITTDKIEKQVAILHSNPSLDGVLTGWHLVNPDGDIIQDIRLWEYSPDLRLRDWFLLMPIGLQSLMISRQCLLDSGKFNSQYQYAMNVELFYNLVTNDYHMTWLPEMTVNHQLPSSSNSLEYADENMMILQNYLTLDHLPDSIKGQQSKILFLASVSHIPKISDENLISEVVQYAKQAIDYYWYYRDLGVYDLATYLGDALAREHVDYDNYSSLVEVLKQSFDLSDTIGLSSQLSIDTDTILHWWLCIWWRYAYLMLPETRVGISFRSDDSFKSYSIAYYQNNTFAI